MAQDPQDPQYQGPGFLGTQITQQVLNRENSDNQFGVSPIPAHSHNGTDSLRISYPTLADKTVNYTVRIPGQQAATSLNYGIFYIAPYNNMRVKQVQEVHRGAGTDGGGVTLNVEKLTGTQALSTGTTILTSGFNLKGGTNVVVTGTLVLTGSNLSLNATDRLGFLLSGTPTNVVDVAVSVTIGY